MTLSQLIRSHVSLCHLYATSLELGYGFRAARAVAAWQRWCPAADTPDLFSTVEGA